VAGGLLVGLELVDDSGADVDKLGVAVTRRCAELGLHMNIFQLPGMGGTFRIAPPLTATDARIDWGPAILNEALADVTA
jgi:2,2-dialkylglycine decarboxylase (pyruvate)